MAKKAIREKSNKSNATSIRKAHQHQKQAKRRHPIKKSNTHWKFKSNHKSLRKFNQKQSKAKKATKKESSIKKEEAEIQLIENENELFDESGYYNQATAPEDKEIKWDDDDNEQEQGLMQGEDLFNQMNQVNDKALPDKVIEAYKVVGEILHQYTSGKLPKAFNILPSTEDWEALIDITDPVNWSPQAMYEATILFSSGFNPLLAERFYVKYLLPAIRNDIKMHKKLNVHYYQCLKKALFKPAAFFKGLIVPLSRSLNEKEAAIFGSIIKKCSIPMIHASAAIMKLIQCCTEGKNGVSIGALFFIKLLLVKRYALPEQVKEGLVKFFGGYEGYNRGVLPVMWHQLLLLFVQGYKMDLSDKEKEVLRHLVHRQSHHLISEEVLKELNYVRNNNVNIKVMTNSNSMNFD